jgi:hypothetical protein
MLAVAVAGTHEFPLRAVYRLFGTLRACFAAF